MPMVLFDRYILGQNQTKWIIYDSVQSQRHRYLAGLKLNMRYVVREHKHIILFRRFFHNINL